MGRTIVLHEALCLLFLVLLATANAHQCVNKLTNIKIHQAHEALSESATITVDPAFGLRNGDWVSATWYNVPNPTDEDWIGLYSQTPFNITSAPVKFLYCNQSETHMTNGSGQLRFRLVNMRSDYTFVIFRGLKKPAALAYSNVVKFANPNEVRSVSFCPGFVRSRRCRHAAAAAASLADERAEHAAVYVDDARCRGACGALGHTERPVHGQGGRNERNLLGTRSHLRLCAPSFFSLRVSLFDALFLFMTGFLPAMTRVRRT
jgi:hypothetical protein